MKWLLFVFTFAGTTVFAQTSLSIETEKFYTALNKGDSAAVANYFTETAQIEHMDKDTSFAFSKEGFLKVCKRFKDGTFRETFTITHESLSPSAVNTVTVDFKFYLNGNLDHCGQDIFIWRFTEDAGYKIERVISSVYECAIDLVQSKKQQKSIKAELNKKLDQWHKTAAAADFEGYFSLMSDDFYYLGTDPIERWSKEQFANFCRPYFAKGEAWTFKAKERNFYFSENMDVVWFDEKLDTWMEECRGTGVLESDTYGNWKLKHYNLTVTIENDKVQDFIKLRKK